MEQGSKRVALVLGAGAGVLALVTMCSSPDAGMSALMSGKNSTRGGAGGVSVVSSGAPVIPISGQFTVTSNFGARWGTLHQGIDLATSAPVPILAAMAGTVTFSGPAGTAGNMVQIDHGNGVVTKSMHLSSLNVATGESVWPGKQIGVEGNTGDSRGMHLHFQVEVNGTAVDPRPFMVKLGVTLPDEGSWGTGPQPATSPPGTDVVMAAGSVAAAKLKEGAVPAPFLPWVVKAGSMCAAVPAPLIAAQIEQESRWNPNARSSVGAQGLSQFMPGTWSSYGRDDDGNGRVSPLDPGDAIMAMGRYDCEIAQTVSSIGGDTTALMLAGYNAGPGAVLLYKGVPPYGETQDYVVRIKAGMAKYSA